MFEIHRCGPTETVALRGLDLRVESGELVAILGPSGSGKSSALHLAAGLDEPSAGEVRVFGRPSHQAQRGGARRLPGVPMSRSCPRGRNLWPELTTARENVELTLRLARRQDTSRDTDRALASFGLAQARTTAGRLALGGRAAARRHRGRGSARGEAGARRRAHGRVGRAQRSLACWTPSAGCVSQFGAAVVVVTHSMRVAVAADRIVELRDGRVTYDAWRRSRLQVSVVYGPWRRPSSGRWMASI